MYIHHQDISTTHKTNVTRTLQSALQTLFALTPGERAKNFSENVADYANGLVWFARCSVAASLNRKGHAGITLSQQERASAW